MSCAFALGLVCAFLAGMGRLAPNVLLRVFCATYVQLFRGTSALVQLFWLFFVLPLWGVTLSPMQAAIIGLGLCSGAYGAEIVRGAVTAVARGQKEAAEALAMNKRQVFFKITLPQALPIMLPSFGNLSIEVLKLTSLVSLVTLGDLTFVAQSINATTMKTEVIFSAVFTLYLIMGLILAAITRLLETRFRVKPLRDVL